MDKAETNRFNSHVLLTQGPSLADQSKYNPVLGVGRKDRLRHLQGDRKYRRGNSQHFGKKQQEAMADLYKVDEE